MWDGLLESDRTKHTHVLSAEARWRALQMGDVQDFSDSIEHYTHLGPEGKEVTEGPLWRECYPQAVTRWGPQGAQAETRFRRQRLQHLRGSFWRRRGLKHAKWEELAPEQRKQALLLSYNPRSSLGSS